MTVYLDHAATSPPSKLVLDYYRDLLSDYAFNPSSTHVAGKKARHLIDESLDRAATCFGTMPDRLIVTSGGTEAINQALACYQTPRRFKQHILISEGEHKAVTAVSAQLAENGAKLSTIALDNKGRPDIGKTETLLDPPPTMISVILLSNETGALTDVKSIVKWRDKHCPQAVIHLDAVQAAGKIDLQFDKLGVDFMSVSGHKWGAPMGLGFLLAKSRSQLRPLIDGAKQQAGLRSGSENAPLLAATVKALEVATQSLDTFRDRAAARKAELLDTLHSRGLPFTCLSTDLGMPHIVTIAFPLRGETLARVLSDHDICIGRGAACSGGKGSQNKALAALGLTDDTIKKAVRISFGMNTTKSDVYILADAIQLAVERFART